MYKLSESLANKIGATVETNFKEQVEFLSQLVKTESINPGSEIGKKVEVEAGVAKILRGKMRELGAKTRYLRMKHGRPNLVATWGAARPKKSLLMVGHMDTSPTEVKNDVQVRLGKIYGNGVWDMKATLTAYVYAFKALRDLGIETEGKLRLAFTVDSKNDRPSKIGLNFLLAKGLKAKSAIMGKPGTGKIAIGHRGGYRFMITTHGKSVNTGRRAWEKGKEGKNAIVDMARIVRALSEFELPFKPARAFPGRRPVFTFPTKITGGTKIDIVPDKCQAWGDVRLMPGNSDKQVHLWIEERLAPITTIKWEIEDLLFVPSVEIERNEPIVQSLFNQSKEVLGMSPKVEGCGPWNESWMLVNKDIPCVAGFGPDGGEENGNEWVDLESLKKVTAIYARTIIDYLGEAK